MSKCDIVIPVYNSVEWLKLCVESIVRFGGFSKVGKIILVDDASNNSTKEEIRKIKNKISKLLVITNKTNLGFVKSCNKGIAKTQEDYVMLLNSDCLLAINTIKKLMAHMEKDKKIGLLCPISNNSANLTFPIPEKLDYITLDKLLEKEFRGINFDACTVAGNCLMISRNCIEKTGVLDETYGMGYGEETDYQFQAMKKGFKAKVAIDTFVFHKSEMSFGSGVQVSKRKKNNLYLFYSRWKNDYDELMAKYNANDPIKFIKNNLSQNDYNIIGGEFKTVKLSKYLKKVELLDKINRNKKHNYLDKIKFIINYRRLHGYRVTLYKAICFIAESIIFGKRSKKIDYSEAMCNKQITDNSEVINTSGIICNYKDFLIIGDGTKIESVCNITELLLLNGKTCDYIDKSTINIEFIKYYRGVILFNIEINKDLKNFTDKVLNLNKGLFTIKDNIEYTLSGKKHNYIIVQNTDIGYDKLYEFYYQSGDLQQGYKMVKVLEASLKKNCLFVLPSIIPCGGVNVVIKHCEILQKQGVDVTIINQQEGEESCYSEGREIPVICASRLNIAGQVDSLVATMCETVSYIMKISKCKNKFYLVQGYETDFYSTENKVKRQMANSTYTLDSITYVTVSEWCRKWLSEYYERNVRMIHNGIELNNFPYTERDFEHKIIILIEGDCSVEYKNVDESFYITNELDRDKYEVYYLTNSGAIKNWYKVDKMYEKIPYKDVYRIYQKAHILLKTSLLESFSYPPLEMMSTGGIVVAISNDGNREYLRDNYNCVLYKKGDRKDAIKKINRIVSDISYRERLIANGRKTAELRSWVNIENEVLEAYK